MVYTETYQKSIHSCMGNQNLIGVKTNAICETLNDFMPELQLFIPIEPLHFQRGQIIFAGELYFNQLTWTSHL